MAETKDHDPADTSEKYCMEDGGEKNCKQRIERMEERKRERETERERSRDVVRSSKTRARRMTTSAKSACIILYNYFVQTAMNKYMVFESIH